MGSPGGEIEVFAEPVSRRTFPQLQAVADDITARRPTAVPPSSRIRTRPGGTAAGAHRRLADGSVGSARADAAVIDDARGLLAAGRTAVLTYGADGQRQDAGMEVFVASHAPPEDADLRRDRLRGGAGPPRRVPRVPGHRVRRSSGVPRRALPRRDEVIADWPDRYLRAQAEQGEIDSRTVVCVLTHDPSSTSRAAGGARLPQLAYVGAMGLVARTTTG
ncbi:xanthine dehydrogenase [Mycobacterium xenopi 3993]|nr:xanthine dehydrogenase [Mycobacterium xenopi 3993]